MSAARARARSRFSRARFALASRRYDYRRVQQNRVSRESRFAKILRAAEPYDSSINGPPVDDDDGDDPAARQVIFDPYTEDDDDSLV